MEELIVHDESGKQLYPICLKDDYNGFASALNSLGMKDRKICIVSDSNVMPLYGETIYSMLQAEGFSCHKFVFKAGEASKNLSTVEKLYEYLIDHSFDRNDVLIAVGGGVTGDLTGYAAATYLRGIRFVGVPTSLLSMVDSSIGGKTGVDFKAYKNIVGAFHAPSLVYINVNALSTLPDREFSAGMGEVIKHAFIRDSKYYDFLLQEKQQILEKDSECLKSMIYRSLCIKKEIVENDPKEKGERALLNFGHTIGHAVEKVNNFTLLHGECVAIGMVAAAVLSVLRGNITTQDAVKVRELLVLYRLPVKTSKIKKDELLSVCHKDKKADGAKIKFILLNSIGEGYIDYEVTDDEIWSAFQTII